MIKGGMKCQQVVAIYNVNSREGGCSRKVEGKQIPMKESIAKQVCRSGKLRISQINGGGGGGRSEKSISNTGGSLGLVNRVETLI